MNQCVRGRTGKGKEGGCEEIVQKFRNLTEWMVEVGDGRAWRKYTLQRERNRKQRDTMDGRGWVGGVEYFVILA